MLPQTDSHILTSNPQFARLHKNLCTTKLNTDGSSQQSDPRTVREHDAFSEQLRDARTALSKKDATRDALRHVAYRGNDLPEELQESVRIVLAQLERKLEPADQDIAIAETENFYENIDEIAAAVSKHLDQQAQLLTRIASPAPSSNKTSLDEQVNATSTNITTLRSQLNSARVALANESGHVLSYYQTLLEAVTRRLEQTIHGSVARATRTQAEYLAHVAEGLDKKLRVMELQVMQQVYTPEVREGLKVQEGELVRENAALRRRTRELEQRLTAFGGVRGMRQIADMYAEVGREVNKVKDEVERLEGS